MYLMFVPVQWVRKERNKDMLDIFPWGSCNVLTALVVVAFPLLFHGRGHFKLSCGVIVIDVGSCELGLLHVSFSSDALHCQPVSPLPLCPQHRRWLPHSKKHNLVFHTFQQTSFARASVAVPSRHFSIWYINCCSHNLLHFNLVWFY